MAEPMKGSIAMLKVKSGEIGLLVPVYFWSKKSDCQGQPDADWKGPTSICVMIASRTLAEIFEMRGEPMRALQVGSNMVKRCSSRGNIRECTVGGQYWYTL